MKSLITFLFCLATMLVASADVSAQALLTTEDGQRYHPVRGSAQVQDDFAVMGDDVSFPDTSVYVVVGDTSLVADTANNAILTLTSLSRGFLPPRMSADQMLAIPTPAAGLQVYCTDSTRMCFFDATYWQCPSGATAE